MQSYWHRAIPLAGPEAVEGTIILLKSNQITCLEFLRQKLKTFVFYDAEIIPGLN